jgi:flagellar hook-associated protein 2
MDGIGFSGIASGIDFRTLVNQIVAAETRPINLVEDQVTATQRRVAAWTDFQTQLGALRSASAALGQPELFSRMTATVPAGSTALRTSVSPSGTASAGEYQVRVDRLATAERLGSRGFESAVTALGFEGSFRIAGRSVTIGAADTLADVAARINQGGGGSGGASASLVSGADGTVRLVVASSTTGARGLELADGPGGVLQELGLLSTNLSVQNLRPDGVAGAAFRDGTTVLSELTGTGATSGTVRFGSVNVALDLGTQTLEEVAESINTASAGAGARVSARVDTRSDGRVELVVQGTTDVEDGGGVLEALGVVGRSREPVARRVEGAAFTTGGVAATATTLLADLDGFDGLAAGTTAGDTLTFQGVRGDGSTFNTTLALTGATTLQDVLNALNDGSNFGGGTRTATASLSPEGRIVLTDDQAGSSQLALSLVAHNEGGGTLSPGSFSVAEQGHAVVLTRGQDAEVEIDGIRVVSSSNTVTEAVPGLSLQLTAVSATPVTVTVAQDRAAAANAMQAMVTAYNTVVDFIRAQSPGPLAEGVARPPLAGDGVLRSLQGRLRSAMALPLLPPGSPFTTLSDVGVTINRQGKYDFNRSTFETALGRNASGVSQLFAARSSSGATAVQVDRFTPATVDGSYGVEITRAASRATVTGTPMAGSYPADASPDQLTIRDVAGGGAYSVSLVGGMTAQAIADALNTSFGTPSARRLELPAYRTAAGSTEAGAGTLLTALEDGTGTPLGIESGQLLTVSGTTPTGAAFLRTIRVGDPGATTLGELNTFVGSVLGSAATVSLENGQMNIQATSAGTSSLQVAISVAASGGGVVSLGPTEVVEPGRGRARMEASVVGGALSIRHLDAGASAGFEVTLTGVGTDNTAALGLPAGITMGENVQGTIGGFAATGTGEQLLGNAGSPVAGLSLLVTGTDLGNRGAVELRRGVGASMENTLRSILESGAGSIPELIENADAQIARMNNRIETMEARLERRQNDLILRFTAMEEAIARAQSQSAWLTSQLGALPSNTQRNR